MRHNRNSLYIPPPGNELEWSSGWVFMSYGGVDCDGDRGPSGGERYRPNGRCTILILLVARFAI